MASASHRDLDKALFTHAGRGRASKRKKKAGADLKASGGGGANDAAFGPKPFRLERLLNVFLYVCCEHEAYMDGGARGNGGADDPGARANAAQREAVLLRAARQHVAEMTRTGELQRVGDLSDLSDVRFKCLVDLDAALVVARHVGFPLNQYLAAGGTK